MYRAKRKYLPPKSVEERIERIQLVNLMTSRAESFLMYANVSLTIAT